MQLASRFITLCLLAFAAVSSSKHTRHDLTLTWEVGSPNGQPREMIRMNGQFPGPELVWDEGDDIEVCTLGNLELYTISICSTVAGLGTQ